MGKKCDAGRNEGADFFGRSYRVWYTGVMAIEPKPASATLKKTRATFFRTAAGSEPVREWLLALSSEDRRTVGRDIGKAEFGWPVGMPLCRPLGDGLHEIRSSLSEGRISRVFFYIDSENEMVLLHSFIKKSQKTPDHEMETARRNKRTHELATKGGRK